MTSPTKSVWDLGFLAFCPNGAQGDSPGQRPVGSNVEKESRPEGAELNGAEIHSPSYPGRRFALPWAISLCPFGAGKQKNPIARGLSLVSCHQRWEQGKHSATPPRGHCPRFLANQSGPRWSYLSCQTSTFSFGFGGIPTRASLKELKYPRSDPSSNAERRSTRSFWLDRLYHCLNSKSSSPYYTI